MKTADLRKILKDNEIHFFSYWGKQKLKDLAGAHNLLPPKKNRKRKSRRKSRKKIPGNLNT